MHWHQVHSQISQVFQVTSHIVGIFTLHLVSTIQLLSLFLFIPFLTCTQIPCRDSHCENVLVRCCLYSFNTFSVLTPLNSVSRFVRSVHCRGNSAFSSYISRTLLIKVIEGSCSPCILIPFNRSDKLERLCSRSPSRQ